MPAAARPGAEVGAVCGGAVRVGGGQVGVESLGHVITRGNDRQARAAAREVVAVVAAARSAAAT